MNTGQIRAKRLLAGPIDCVSAGVIAFRSLMKSPLHNVNKGKRPFAKRAVVVALAFVAVASARTRGQDPALTLSGPSFIPDGRASTLAGWHTLGQATWRADQGEIVGDAGPIFSGKAGPSKNSLESLGQPTG
jgi:hypothetical protein